MKSQIQDCFNNASSSYDATSLIQYQCAEQLVNILRHQARDFLPQTILDLGTGTGHLPKLLYPYYPNAVYTLNDMAPEMLLQAQQKLHPSQAARYVLGDMENTPFTDHDLIMSNFAFQWLGDLPSALHKFYNLSQVFAFSCLLDGTLQDWEELLKSYNIVSPLRRHPTTRHLTEILDSFTSSSLYTKTKEVTVTFPNAYSFMYYLRRLGASASTTSIPYGQLRKVIKNHLDDLTVTYKLMFVILQR
jgi:malonyl-CoA O-methyltransferase